MPSPHSCTVHIDVQSPAGPFAGPSSHASVPLSAPSPHTGSPGSGASPVLSAGAGASPVSSLPPRPVSPLLVLSSSPVSSAPVTSLGVAVPGPNVTAEAVPSSSLAPVEHAPTARLQPTTAAAARVPMLRSYDRTETAASD